MRYLKLITAIYFLSFLFSWSQEIEEKVIYNDGPYIFQYQDTFKIIKVSDGNLSIEKTSEEPSSFVVKSDCNEHEFRVKLHPIIRPEYAYDSPEKLIVISDPHGNLDAFLSILRAQEVIDDKYNWTFGTNHLMIIGDVFDRGNDVLPIFWLIYKLEGEAIQKGGRVHFLLGNHEELVLRNDIRYVEDKYKYLAEELNVEYNELWNINSILGKWLSTRNTIEIIGDNLFVHAGLSKEFLDQKWSIPQLNDSVSSFLGEPRIERNKSDIGKFLYGSNGPLWYRGMVRDDIKYNPISEEDVDAILKRYNVKHIFLGHTIFPEVHSFYNGKVIGVNVNNKKNKENNLSRGVLIKRNKRYLIYDDLLRNNEMGSH